MSWDPRSKAFLLAARAWTTAVAAVRKPLVDLEPAPEDPVRAPWAAPLRVACPLFFTNARVAATMRTAIGLPAATGLRIGEAIRLTIPELDVADHLLLVHGTKTPLDRLVPLDPSTTTAPVDYANLPERVATKPSPIGPIFVSNPGSALVVDTVEQHFSALVDALQLTPPGQRRPRLHNLRH